MGDARDNAKKKKADEKKSSKGAKPAAKPEMKAAPANPPQKTGKK